MVEAEKHAAVLKAHPPMARVKVFITGAVLGAIFGAAVLGPIVHFLLIAAVVIGVGAALHRGRRLMFARTRRDKHLEA